jgi:folate-binding protein YgfZ
MADRSCVALEGRGVLEIGGADRRSFLQGLVSNDVDKVGPDRAVHAALLTPQGKYLHDFFITEIGLKRRLSLYMLRSKVTLAEASDRFVVAAAFGPGALAALGLPAERGAAQPFGDGLAYVDPRLPALGARLLLPRAAALAPLVEAGFTATEDAAYDRLRLSCGVPDGSRDLPVEKAILLEAGFDELNGVDWQKGCYVGQELTARTKYRGLIKKRLMPVAVDGPLAEPGTLVMLGDREAGELRSGRDGIALALLRLEAVAEADKSGVPLVAGEARLTPHKPDWASF